ncbi:MAG: hypothetical protein GXO87_07115 [Chlorobi bacterium]|nr:hypothetical protein [Chlorobiota bacterium]
MKKSVLFLTAFFFAAASFAQVDVSAGMGINYASNSDLNDYINGNFAYGDKLNSFSTNVEFYGELAYAMSPTFSLGVEYAMSIFSFNNQVAIIYDLTYNLHKPSLVAYYVISGKGYKFKFGGGVGPRFANVVETIHEDKSYSSAGYGFLLRGEGHTGLGGNFYAMVAADMRYDVPGKPKEGDNFLGGDRYGGIEVSQIAFGIKLGVTYTF